MSTLTAGQDRGNFGYYELRNSPGKGVGAFALKNIDAGTTILKDTHLFFLSDRHSNATIRHNARVEYSQLRGDEKLAFDAMPAFARSDEDDEQELQADPFNKFCSNQFRLRGGRLACFAYASRFNHSCDPNSRMTQDDQDRMDCIVFKNVSKGQELTFAYTEAVLYMSFDERQELAGARFWRPGIPCSCSLCSRPQAERTTSDSRRTRLRCLLYAWNGEDAADDALTKIREVYSTSVFGEPNCQERGEIEPLRQFIDVAEQEGIASGMLLRFACRDAANFLLEQAKAQERGLDRDMEFLDFKRWTNIADRLKRDSGGKGYGPPGNEAERIFDEDISNFRRIIAEMEGSSS